MTILSEDKFGSLKHNKYQQHFPKLPDWSYGIYIWTHWTMFD